MNAKLNEYAQKVSDFIAQVHPEWMQCAQSDEKAVASSGALKIEIPPPTPGRPSVLILTDGDYLTVEFDRRHDYFDNFAGDQRLAFSKAIAFVESLLSEELSIVITMRGENWIYSDLIKSGDTPLQPAPGCRRYVRSWRGTWDQEYLG